MVAARVSPFPSRARVRPAFPSIGQGARFIEVTTEDQLRAALTPRDTSSIAARVADVGRRIVITAPITLKAPIIIDASLAGTTIESHGKLPIFCGVDGIDAFDVRAPLVTIRDLLITSPDVTGTTGGPGFARAVVFKAGANNGRLLDVDVYGCDSLVVGEDGADSCHVRGCEVLVTSSANANAVTVDGTDWRITANTLDGAGTGLAVEVTANGGRCAIVGNDCGTSGITTSASAGSNTISANTRAGVVTAHATDDTLGGNT
jgi:hypothetical protein